MAPTAADIQQFLTTDLEKHEYFMAEGDAPPDATPEEFAIFAAVRVRKLGPSSFQVRYLEGPGWFTCLHADDIPHEAVARLQEELPETAGLRFEVVVDQAEAMPHEVVQAIEAEAETYLREHDHFVSEVGETDPERWAVLERAVAVVMGERELEIAWSGGPGFARLDPAVTADGLCGDLVERLRKRVPGVKGWRIRMAFAED